MSTGPVPLREESCYAAAAATCMPTGLVYLPQTPLLFKHAYWLSAAARWLPAGPLSLNHISMPADVLPLNPAYLLSLCFSICHTCWYGDSLSAVPAGMVPHYQPYLLVWCLTIGNAFWCGASL